MGQATALAVTGQAARSSNTTVLCPSETIPFCGEGNNCFRIGTDPTSNAYIAVADALRALILEIKAGKADHLL
ncbi:hypothetical protein [Streptomyces sp. 3214.6]|uniref:hypothetical protein n=1 Tax=Streptomyces sp. 3214.6 TaxID=1882757 RepID=UPI00090C3C45|nr:hypothetical protein [Streptomyces sp. 3214.6]SHI18839.1 hypothetical protein SAMN05444521_5056 [Streptomyces sp. 3214.6]